MSWTASAADAATAVKAALPAALPPPPAGPGGGFRVPPPVDLAAIALGGLQAAVLGTSLAEDRDVDIIGVMALGIAVGVGGGVVRDILLNQLPVTLTTPSYLLTALAATIAGITVSHWIARLGALMVMLDAGALGLFMAVGVIKASGSGLGVLPTVFVGTVAAVGGGILRDLLLRNEVAMMQTGSLYVAAAVIGGCAYEALRQFLLDGLSATIAIGCTFAVRMLSVHLGWRTPSPARLRLPATVTEAIEDPVRRAARRASRRGRGRDGS